MPRVTSATVSRRSKGGAFWVPARLCCEWDKLKAEEGRRERRRRRSACGLAVVWLRESPYHKLIGRCS